MFSTQHTYYDLVTRPVKVRPGDWQTFNKRVYNCKGVCTLGRCMCHGVTETFHKIIPMGLDEHMVTVRDTGE